MVLLKQRYEEILEFIAKIMYFCLAVSTFNAFIYASSIQPLFVRLALISGAVLILVRMIKYRKYMKMPGIILMALFCLSFLLSTWMNREYGILENGKWIVWTGIQFFALYVCNVDRSRESYRKEFRLLAHLMIGYSMIASVVSLGMLVTYYSEIIVTASEEVVISGFTWGRLWGIYTDPNYGGVFSVIAIVLSLLFLVQKKGKIRIFYGVGIVLNLLYLIFSDSRTGEIALICSVGLFVFFYLLRKLRDRKPVLRFGLPALAVLCIALGTVGGARLIKTGYNQKLAPILKELFPEEEKDTSQVKKQVGRKKDIEKDVSNGRFALWESAVEVWETSPVYGTGYSTFISYTTEHVPDTYAVNTGGDGDYSSMHNQFFNILVFQGTIGFVLFLLIAGRLVIYVLPCVLHADGEDYLNLTAMLAGISAVGISMVFLLEGFYTNSPGSFVLWVFAGYMVHYSYQERNEETL